MICNFYFTFLLLPLMTSEAYGYVQRSTITRGVLEIS